MTLLSRESQPYQAGVINDAWQLVQSLRTGGYNMVVRHGATFPNQADTDPFEGGHHAAITRPAGPDTNDTKSMAKRHRHDGHTIGAAIHDERPVGPTIQEKSDA